jgi:hypothetical protein
MNAFVSVEASFIVDAYLVDQSVHVVSAARNHIREASTVDLPSMIQQNRPANVVAFWAAAGHLLQPKVTTIGEVELRRQVRHGVNVHAKTLYPGRVVLRADTQ